MSLTAKESIQKRKFTSVGSFIIPYNVASVKMLGGLLWQAYDQAPERLLGDPIWQALTQLEYQDYIDYALPESWSYVMDYVVKKPGTTSVKLLFPTNARRLNSLYTMLMSFKGADSFQNVIQQLLNQLIDPKTTRITWTFTQKHQAQMSLQRTAKITNIFKKLEKPVSRNEV